ncbi:MAG TPA: hypothetical protein VH834_01960 [Solirubrobacteraceae bacterium]
MARGDNADEVIATIEGHIREDHPELASKVTRDDLLGWIEEV